ncbi:hypothetical protein J4402_05205 [Candidatus Pacearchaeota archaeon]|nr:hypothetical protein [Candidatus Pacearchaeota archaeon]
MDVESESVCSASCIYIVYRGRNNGRSCCRYQHSLKFTSGLERVEVSDPCIHPEACEHKLLTSGILSFDFSDGKRRNC